MGGFASTPVSGEAAVDLSQRLADLKTKGWVESAPTVRIVGGHRFREVDGLWVDERFDASAPTVVLQPFGASYFRLLERHPDLKDILALGDRLIWVAPNGTALVIDEDGPDEIPDATLDALFDESARQPE